jgi:hypothetical protein
LTDSEEDGWKVWRLFVPQPPMALALILGDAVQNLRIALEYVIHELTGDRRSSFPVTQNRADWEKRSRPLEGLRPEVREAIERAQPFIAPAPAAHPLSMLAYVSNGDKHRALQLLQVGRIDMVGDIQFLRPTSQEHRVQSGGKVGIPETWWALRLTPPWPFTAETRVDITITARATPDGTTSNDNEVPLLDLNSMPEFVRGLLHELERAQA